ncbi:MAG: ASCH domain-containing protein [Dehalococcoidia bacterium]|nr:ASCH domain-containing protein [Dehalococcoidia bacterium]
MPEIAERELPAVALSVRQPWAWLIVNGYKPVENRTWPTNFRGPVAIHAGQTYDMEGDSWVRDMFPEIPLPRVAEIERGGIVGVARVTDCVQTMDSTWFFGPYGFVLDAARTVPFVACRGKLGFFRWVQP